MNLDRFKLIIVDSRNQIFEGQSSAEALLQSRSIYYKEELVGGSGARLLLPHGFCLVDTQNSFKQYHGLSEIEGFLASYTTK